MTKPIYATQAADRKEDSAQLQDFFFFISQLGIIFLPLYATQAADRKED
jgi:hypothetical protein